MAFDHGPYLQAACLCDTAIEAKDGTVSLIRIIDTLTSVASGPNPPTNMPATQFTVMLVVMLKSGNARGRCELCIVPELPTGETKEPLSFTVHLEGEERGQNVIVRLTQQFPIEGLYWYNITLDGQKLTSIPLRVKYDRIVAGPRPRT